MERLGTKDVLRALGEEHVCAVHGLPGVGKSRLLQRVRRALAEVAEVVLVDVHGRADAWAAVEPALTRAPVLLVDGLDGRDAPKVAPRLLEWVDANAKRRLVVASRLPSMRASRALRPLALPERDAPLGDSPAGELWRTEAARVLGGEAREEDDDAVRRILHLCDGLPLAITELAGLLAMLDEEAILDRLEHAPAKILRAAGPAESNTLARFEAFWGALPPTWRSGLTQSMAFAGEFDAAAAEEVVELASGSMLEVMRGAIEASLLFARGEVGARRVRARALLRAMPRDDEELAGARARHARYVAAEVDAGRVHRVRSELMRAATTFATQVEDAEEAASGAAAELLQAIDIAALTRHEADEYLALLTLLFPEEPPVALERRHTSALRRLARYDDARDVIERASARVEHRAEEAPPGLRAELLAELGALHLDAGELEDALGRLEEALDVLRRAGSAHDRATALVRRGEVLHELGRPDDAQADLEESYLLFREEGNQARVGHALLRLARVRTSLGRTDAATRALDDAARVAEDAELPLLVGHVVLGRALVQHVAGRLSAAETLYARAAQIFAEHGSDADLGIGASYRALLHHAMRQLDEASLHAREARTRLERTGLRRQLTIAEAASVGIEAELGHEAAARARLRELESLLGARRDPVARFVRVCAAHLEGEAAPSEPDPPSVELRLARWTLVGRTSAKPFVVQEDGRGFARPDGETVDLARRKALRRILAALAVQRRDAPGQALSMDALFDAGWPGETLGPEHAANRVYNAISALRSFGLKDVLVRRDDGYLLDPAVPLTVG